ncbi:MAG: geranylgeranylglycerol-phosphate geranylgeranyltransferase [Thermosphaera sp.]
MAENYFKMIRPLNSFMSGLGVVFSLLVFNSYRLNQHVLLLAVIGFTTGFTATAASMLVNDIVDIEVDRVNKPWKPLPSGRASVKAAWILTVVFSVVSVAVNIIAGPSLVVVTAAYLAIGLLYNFMRKHWWSQFMVSASTTGPIVYGYVASGLPREALGFTILFTLTIFIVNTGREVLKAVQDIEGDKALGYETIPLKIGVPASIKILKACSVTGPLTGVLAGVLGKASILYLALILAAGYLYSSSLLKTCMNPGDKQALEKSRRTTLRAMLLGLVAFWASRIGFTISF